MISVVVRAVVGAPVVVVLSIGALVVVVLRPGATDVVVELYTALGAGSSLHHPHVFRHLVLRAKARADCSLSQYSLKREQTATVSAHCVGVVVVAVVDTSVVLVVLLAHGPQRSGQFRSKGGPRIVSAQSAAVYPAHSLELVSELQS